MQFLILMMFFTYFGGAYQLFAIGSYGFTALDLFTVLFFLMFIKRILWDGEELKFGMNWALGFLLLLIPIAVLSSIHPLIGGDKGYIIQYLKTTAHFLYLVLFTVVCGLYPFKADTWTKVIKLWMICALIINVFGVYQIGARAFDWPLAWLKATNVSLVGRSDASIEGYQQLSLHFESFYRATSIFSEPSALAAFNLHILAFVAIPVMQGYKPFFKSRTLNWSVFASSIIAIFLAFSLSGLVGVVVFTAALVLFQKGTRITRFASIVLISLILLVITDLIVSNYTNISVLKLFSTRVESIFSGKKTGLVAGESYYGRMGNAMVMLDMWKGNPVFGCGLGLTSSATDGRVGFSDNAIMAVLGEMGILGFIAFTGLFVATTLITLRMMRKPWLYKERPEEEKRLYGIFFFVMINIFMTNYLSVNNLVSYWLWMPLGIIFGVMNRYKIEMGENVHVIRFVKTPWKNYFYNAIGKTLEAGGKKA